MSSNPFHRPVHSPEYTSTGPRRPLSDSHAAGDDPAPPHPPKASASTITYTKKQVRISSPPRSPSPRRDHGPRHSGAYDDSPQQPVAEQRATPNVPHNPFSRTLADMEESLGTSGVERAPEVAERSGSQPDRSTGRAAMDVNAFKTLLMTGKASPRSGEVPAPPAHRPAALTLADNSSSTDTSSISRHSIMDNLTHETPRSSYERSISDDEEKPTVLPQRTQSKRAKPPLPRHRHGKSVSSSGPQIVAFDDFSKVEHEQALASPTEETPKPRTSSETKRPLPPLPSARGAMKEALADAKGDQARDPTPSPDITERAPSQSKKPPPPPLARRLSQRTPVSSLQRSRSGTSSSRPSLMEDNESIAESTTSSTRVAPPPPPARRSGHSGSYAADKGSPASINRAPNLKSPPPPPSRNRASSNLSSTSIPSSTLSMTPTGPSSPSGNNPPPKPPPPRRTSSRSSIEILSPRRTSGEAIRSSFDSERRPSFSSSVRRVPITEEPAQNESATVTSPTATKDILADMDAFQREIDALMAKDELGKRKGSSGSGSGSGSVQRPGRPS